MKTLKHYDLQKGDWVKLTDFGWGEFRKYNSNNDNQRFHAAFYDHGWMSEDHKVESVLRPSVIIRDILDKTLERLKQDCHTCKYTQPYLVFDIIHPKERKKSLKEKCSLNYPMDALDVFNTFHLLCEEIEELKKGDK